HLLGVEVGLAKLPVDGDADGGVVPRGRGKEGDVAGAGLQALDLQGEDVAGLASGPPKMVVARPAGTEAGHALGPHAPSFDEGGFDESFAFDADDSLGRRWNGAPGI